MKQTHPQTGAGPTPEDARRWSAVEPHVSLLLEAPTESAAALQAWLETRSGLDAACSEARADLYIAMTRRTDDEGAVGDWTRYLEETAPKLKEADFALNRRQADLSARFPLDPERYAVIERDTRVEVELFRDENVPIETELAKLDQQYDAIIGAQSVRFQGEERTLQQMGVFLEDTDRSVRETAWRAVASRRIEDRAAIDGIFDTMVERRARLARNAGFGSFRDYAFKMRHRFDYGVGECEAFHDACERVVSPFVRALDEERAVALGAAPLAPWDLAVDPKGRPPLRPFEGGEELFGKTGALFDRMDPELGAMFRSLRDGDALDLDSRKGKAAGGYQYMRDASRRPFIFMNAAGLQRDAQTLIHEAGHAFHSLLCAGEPLLHYRHSPIEFAEVASMSMELLTMPFWDAFYDDEEDLRRAQREQLEGVVTILPWIASIDAFQHAIYTRAEDHDARTDAWLSIVDRFGRRVSWEGLEEERASMWQKQGHLFGSPFYYIEYGIAQLGALQLWLVSKEKGLPEALQRYKRALALGGSRPLPALFAAAGLDFDFSPKAVESLVSAVRDELDATPA